MVKKHSCLFVPARMLALLYNVAMLIPLNLIRFARYSISQHRSSQHNVMMMPIFQKLNKPWGFSSSCLSLFFLSQLIGSEINPPPVPLYIGLPKPASVMIVELRRQKKTSFTKGLLIFIYM